MTVLLVIGWFVTGFIGSLGIYQFVKDDRSVSPESRKNFAAFSILAGPCTLAMIILVGMVILVVEAFSWLVEKDVYRKIVDFVYRP